MHRDMNDIKNHFRDKFQPCTNICIGIFVWYLYLQFALDDSYKTSTQSAQTHTHLQIFVVYLLAYYRVSSERQLSVQT